MRVSIDEDYCVGSGVCEMICPEVFEVDGIARVKVDPIPPEHQEPVREAATGCPTEAIVVSERGPG